ncbi:MAG: hypothetical protein HYY96_04350 [Candidatus Tectomicrobia bacterium]|nr:hypothetical protein [Candidatus Tectomicrobia bacterium]
MRFVVTGEWRANTLLRLILLLFLLFVALLWLTNALLFFSKMSLSPASIVEFYRGSEARFLTPRSYQGLLEMSHFHLFAMGILLMTMAHLLLFARLSNRVKAWTILISFLGALADEGGGWLVRFAHPGFASLKLAGFVALQLGLGVMIIACALAAAYPQTLASRASGIISST